MSSFGLFHLAAAPGYSIFQPSACFPALCLRPPFSFLHGGRGPNHLWREKTVYEKIESACRVCSDPCAGLQCGLLSAGVRSGATETAMAQLADRCQAESDQRLTALLSRFEYILVLILCVSVGAVLLSVMLPLLGVVSSIGAG